MKVGVHRAHGSIQTWGTIVVEDVQQGEVIVQSLVFRGPVKLPVSIDAHFAALILQRQKLHWLSSGRQDLVPRAGKLESDGSKVEKPRLVGLVVSGITGQVEIVVPAVPHVGHGISDVGAESILQHHRKLKTVGGDCVGDRIGKFSKQTADVTVGALHPVPIDDDAIDPRGFHKQQVILDHVGITGGVGLDQGVEMARNVTLSIGQNDVWGCDFAASSGIPTALALQGWTLVSRTTACNGRTPGGRCRLPQDRP